MVAAIKSVAWPRSNRNRWPRCIGIRKETAESQTAASTVAYAEGRQARIAYETWFNGLPEGSYKEGVTYWVSHRSLKPPPNCVGDTADGLAGCNAARARFAPIDYRRLSDKNYWFGWNSL